MNIRSIISMDILKDNRVYSLSIPLGAPFEEAFAVCDALKQDLLELQENQKKQAAELAAKEAKPEEVQAEIV